MSGSERTAIRSVLWVWLLVGAAALLATVGTLLALSATVYSAQAFVGRYFSAVAADNVAEILRTPGVAIPADDFVELGLPADTSSALLRPGVVTATPTNVAVVGDVSGANGRHTVSVRYTLAGTAHTVDYQVEPVPALLGIIPRWRFVTSPLQLLSVTVNNGSHFSAVNLELDTRAAGADPAATSQTGNYLAIAPAQLTLHYDSELAVAPPVEVLVLPGVENAATLSVEPTQVLVDRVQHKLDDFLAECVTQTVLEPSGCPFGKTITDRVLADPSWSIVHNPLVTLAPGAGGFLMPATPGIVHLSVPVQSLYDGSKSTLSEDVNYQVGLLVTIRDDGSIAIQLR